MEIYVDRNILHILLSQSEAHVLIEALSEVVRNYRVNPGDLDARTASTWYSTRGCQTAGMSGEETREWQEQLHAFRGENLVCAENALHQLDNAKAGRCKIALPLDQAPTFLTIVNDHRLYTAAKYDLNGMEMDMDKMETLLAMAPEQRRAHAQVAVLGYLMEWILQALPNSGADWRESSDEEPIL